MEEQLRLLADDRPQPWRRGEQEVFIRESRRAKRLILQMIPPYTLELVVPQGTGWPVGEGKRLLLRVECQIHHDLAGFGQSLATYTYQIVMYLTFNTEEQPFPFADWPSGPPG